MAREGNFEWDVALSFAGEDRQYVEEVARLLNDEGIRVFYDAYEKAQLWGKDLYEHLDWVYRQAARYCVLFASEHYAAKVWTSHERKSAQARAIEDNEEYILPARFDDTEIPGLRPTIGYIDLRETSSAELAKLTLEKLGPTPTEDFFPPRPNRLFEVFEAEDAKEQEIVYWRGRKFFDALRRMSEEERAAVFATFTVGCVAELPQNVHISLELVRRYTGLPASQLLEIFRDIRVLGFQTELRDADDNHSPSELVPEEDKMLYVEWHLMVGGDRGGNATHEAHAVIGIAMEGYCEAHGQEALERLDFSNLGSSTAKEDVH